MSEDCKRILKSARRMARLLRVIEDGLSRMGSDWSSERLTEIDRELTRFGRAQEKLK